MNDKEVTINLCVTMHDCKLLMALMRHYDPKDFFTKDTQIKMDEQVTKQVDDLNNMFIESDPADVIIKVTDSSTQVNLNDPSKGVKNDYNRD